MALPLACTGANPAYRPRVNDDVDAREAPSEVAGEVSGEVTPEEVALDPPEHPAADLAEVDTAPMEAGSMEAGSMEAGSMEASAETAMDALPPLDLPSDQAVTVEVPPAPTGLVARWRLDPAAGGAVPDDVGGNHGTLQGGATWNAEGYPGGTSNPGSLKLDGIDGCVKLGTATLPRLDHAKSISVWFYVSAVPTVERQTLIILSNAGQFDSIQLGLELGKPAVWSWADATGQGLLYSAFDVRLGWNHLGYTYDGAKHALYVNAGMVATSTSTHGTARAAVLSAVLGAWDPVMDLEEHFGGLIDDVRVYDRALDAKEIAAVVQGAP
jgi:hypothetical protein